MRALREQQGSASVTEVVKSDVRLGFAERPPEQSLLARMRFGSLRVTALCELDPSKEGQRSIGRMAAPLARKDGSHHMHRATKVSVSSSRVRIEA
jgi:hypothetical protein